MRHLRKLLGSKWYKSQEKLKTSAALYIGLRGFPFIDVPPMPLKIFNGKSYSWRSNFGTPSALPWAL